jgi:hypothetical protein
MKRKWILTLAVAPVLLGASPLFAQSLRPAVSVSVAYTHDDNVDRLNSADSALRGIQSSDDIFSPAINLNLTHALGRETVYLQGSAGYDYYAQNTLLNSERINLAAGGTAKFGRCSANLSASLMRGQSDLEDLVASITKNVETLPTYTLGFSCARIIGLSPTFTITDQTATNSAPILRSSNFKSLSETAGISYDRPALGTVTLYGQHSRSDYDNRDVLGGVALVEDGFDTYGGGLRYQRRIGARLTGEVSIGYTAISTEAAALSSSSGMTYDASLDYKVSSRLGAHVSFTRAFLPSNRLDTTYSLSTVYAASASYTVGARWSLNAGVSSSDQHLQGIGLIAAGSDTQETLNSVNASANYAFSRRISFGLNARYEHRSANVAIYDYSDTQFGLTAQASF